MTLFAAVRCWSVRNVLDLFVDRRLSDRASARVAAHLADCPDCRAEAAEMGPVLQDDLDAIAVPAGLEAAILAKLEEESPLPEPGGLLDGLRLEPAQAAALLYLVLLTGGNSLPGLPTQSALDEARGPAAIETPGREDPR